MATGRALRRKRRPEIKSLSNRHNKLAEWADLLAKVAKRGVLIYGYANNHYAGHAPATVELFREMWRSATGTTTLPASRVYRKLFSTEAQDQRVGHSRGADGNLPRIPFIRSCPFSPIGLEAGIK
jgi:hypothetical protein